MKTNKIKVSPLQISFNKVQKKLLKFKYVIMLKKVFSGFS